MKYAIETAPPDMTVGMGDVVRIRWWGDRNVPATMSGATCEVLSVSARGNFKLREGGNPVNVRSIGKRHVYGVVKGGVIYRFRRPGWGGE